MSYKLFFQASDPLIDGFYISLLNKGSEAHNQSLSKILQTIWFDTKIRLACLCKFNICRKKEERNTSDAED